MARHGVFPVDAKDAERGDGKNEFGRVSERLGIWYPLSVNRES
ncbi:MAG: hypothetical protein ACXVBB_23425 [Isosphaeraceae bacterium]